MRNDKLDSKSFFLSFFLSLVLETQLNHFTKKLKVLNFQHLMSQYTGNGGIGTALRCTPPAVVCSAGASAQDNECKCDPGYSGDALNCVACDAGEYKEEHGDTSCQTCPPARPLSTSDTGSQNSCFACTSGPNTVASDAKDSCVCQPGYEKKFADSGCTACAIGFYKQSKGNTGTCNPCFENAVTPTTGSTNVNDCTCDGEQGWKLVGAICSQPETTITKYFTLKTKYTDFHNDVGSIRTNFKAVLMAAYGVMEAEITLTYHDTNTPNVVESGRRRRLLQSSETTTITAKIRVFETKSNDVSDVNIQTALTANSIDANSITILDDITEIEENGSSPDTMMIIVIVVVSCVFVFAMGFVACQLHQKTEPKFSKQSNDGVHIDVSKSQTVFISDPQYNADNYFDVYCGPQSF